MFGVNWVALYFIYKKETLRFLKIYHQTIFTPVINALLFYSVFTLAFGARALSGGAISFELIIATGLTIMSVLQNCYTNSSSSIAMSKILGHLTDYLIPPIKKTEILIAHIAASTTRGVICAISVWLSLAYFSGLCVAKPLWLTFYLLSSCFIFSSLGVIFGSLSNSFDRNHAYNTYFISPLTFLSGTFYQVSSLPIFWQNIIKLNPVYYMIDGFRYGATGYSDIANHLHSAIYLIIFCVLSYFGGLFCLKKYYKIS
jgi:ABC-2 type transport system permease protein